eukprot:1182782-Prorocentrum_minimum.AAC.2
MSSSPRLFPSRSLSAANGGDEPLLQAGGRRQWGGGAGGGTWAYRVGMRPLFLPLGDAELQKLCMRQAGGHKSAVAKPLGRPLLYGQGTGLQLGGRVGASHSGHAQTDLASVLLKGGPGGGLAGSGDNSIR